MRYVPSLLCTALCVFLQLSAASGGPVLEPWSYSQDFESRELSAWASYPLWQDTAYDEKIRAGTIVPGDPNISIEQRVIPYSNVDTYAGAQKKFDAYIVPGSAVSFRYYLKTHLPVEFIKVRLAAGPAGKVDYTVNNPAINRWIHVTVSYDDFVRENPALDGENIKMNALAFLAKVPDADPALDVYLGLDDIEVNGARAAHFRFDEPEMYKLSEWKPYIPANHYRKNDTFRLSGSWMPEADRITVVIRDFTDSTKTVHTGRLSKKSDAWNLNLKLSYQPGLYHGMLEAFKKNEKLSRTEFTFYILPEDFGGHPRLWFDAAGEKRVIERLESERFGGVREHILAEAKRYRDDYPVDEFVFDIGEFPDEDWLGTHHNWFDRVRLWEHGSYYNALAYALLGVEEAGTYVRDMMVEISGYPYWLHPWMEKRGRHIYYPLGETGMGLAVAYDLVYDILSRDDRALIEHALMEFVVKGCHEGYVVDDLVTNNTSNWVAHITGGSMMCQAVLYGDNPALGSLEPYFTGAIMKNYDLIQKTLDKDGAYGEGYGYYNFSMLSWSKSLPAMENVFNIDMSGKLHRSYNELVWAGVIKEKEFFYFGDSSGSIRPMTNFAWLLAKYKEPLLGWLYNYTKNGETFMDVLYETRDVPKDDPFDENPVRVFRDVGTTVFKSGWDTDDFVFVMRTGPFYNHQHLDQGTFWLRDRGSLFIEERHGSTYYVKRTYQSHYIQPICHSTILIDHNEQSQRTGDPLAFAEGFEDYAFLTHFLDGDSAAFSSGNIGRLYWGNIKDITRSALYLKPRTVILIDVVTPADRDVDVTELFQTHYLDDITPGNRMSSIEKDGNTLFLRHLMPDGGKAEAIRMPHFVNTLLNEKILYPEGALAVTNRTDGEPVVLAHIMTSTDGDRPVIITDERDGCFAGQYEGAWFAVTTNPGTVYAAGDFKTDALTVTWNDSAVFAAKCTSLIQDNELLVRSFDPVTCEVSDRGISLYACTAGDVIFGTEEKPKSVEVNGKNVKFKWDSDKNGVVVSLPAGESTIKIQ